MKNPSNYSVSTVRGANMVRANAQRIGSSRDQRWATGRNVKIELSEAGTYGVAEVWTLKERDSRGKVRTVATHMPREDAEAFVAGK